jgi:Flp pilus assembly protein TadG
MIVFPSGCSQNSPAGRGGKRRGSATVEFAAIAPLFVFLTLGMIEISRGILVKQTLSDAARRAARTGAQPGTSTAAIVKDVNDILTDNQIDPTAATVTVLVNGQANDALTARQNDQISVKVAIPVSKVMWLTAIFLTAPSIESETVYMMRYDSGQGTP